MDRSKSLKYLISEHQADFAHLMATSDTFNEIVADHKQLAAALTLQLNREGPIDDVAVNDISAALTELEDDVRDALNKYQDRD